MKRTLIEIAVAVLLLLIFFGYVRWAENRHEAELEAERTTSRETILRTQTEAATWATALAQSEAEAVAQSFVAGIQPALAASRRDVVESAVGALVKVRDVTFIHVLEPDGRVIASTDLKLTSLGQAGPDADWALDAGQLATRADRGVTEVAAPVPGVESPLAIVWLGYATERLAESARLGSLAAPEQEQAAEPAAP